MSAAETLAGGRYRVERELGRGAMACVYLAHDEALDRPVALKLLDDHAADAGLRERFVREARHAAKLAHPNVVMVFDAGEDEGRPYLVMEYVDGQTLADLLRRRRRLPPSEVAVLGTQAAEGLDHAHAAGLVHRDVKPANLLLRRDGVLKVADFGIARAADGTRLTAHGTLLGTAGYLAPELAAGGEASPASDVYGLGVVLYEALAGEPPHRIESLADLARRQDEPPPALRDADPSIPEPLEHAVMRCLARAPEYRPTARQLSALLAGEEERPTESLLPTRALAAPPPRVTTSIPGRAPALWLGLAAVVAALAVALGILAGHGGGGSGVKQPRQATFTPAPVQPGASPADEARNLSAWLRRYAAR